MQSETPITRRYRVPDLGTGEGAFWHAAEQALYFVDIQAPALFRLDPETGELKSWKMPSAIGSFGLCHDGRAIVALRTGLYFFDFATEALTFIVNPEDGLDSNRLNDGKVGPDGRFWVGSMDDRPDKKPIAGLYRIDHNGGCTRMVGDLTVSNGLAWSPDSHTLYHSDSRQAFLQAFDYDLATGDLSNQRRIRGFTNEEGRPDGAAMDVEGCYWSAGVSAGCVNRISPEGAIVQRFELPVPSPTMPCFGGPDLQTLFVTSLSTSRLGPHTPGTLISFRVDVAGTPGALFGPAP